MSEHPDGDDIARILRARARGLARPNGAETPRNLVECIVFRLAAENFAVETGSVREIYPLKDLTPIPCTPKFVLGIVNLRGELYPIIDVKSLLGMPSLGLTNATRAVIIHHADMELGIMADAVLGVRAVATADIRPPPQMLSGINARFLRGVTREPLAILDVPAILGDPGIIVDERVEL